MNKCISVPTFLANLKSAKVVPLLMKDKKKIDPKNLKSNYRPVCILANICSFMSEKLVRRLIS